MVAFEDIEGFAFDMDGVLADTARFHAIAWHQIADEVGTVWDDELAEALKGIDRMGSLELILEHGNAAEKYDAAARDALATKKNDNYRNLIATLTPADALPGMLDFLESLQTAGYKMSIASASKNAPFIVERLGMQKYFDAIVDPASLSAGKPDPAIFIAAAAAIELAPEKVIGLEDSAAGIKSINAAGELSIGIGDSKVLHEADLNFATTADVTLARIKAALD